MPIRMDKGQTKLFSIRLSWIVCSAPEYFSKGAKLLAIEVAVAKPAWDHTYCTRELGLLERIRTNDGRDDVDLTLVLELSMDCFQLEFILQYYQLRTLYYEMVQCTVLVPSTRVVSSREAKSIATTINKTSYFRNTSSRKVARGKSSHHNIISSLRCLLARFGKYW
jgi:hypothetical protein